MSYLVLVTKWCRYLITLTLLFNSCINCFFMIYIIFVLYMNMIYKNIFMCLKSSNRNFLLSLSRSLSLSLSLFLSMFLSYSLLFHLSRRLKWLYWRSPSDFMKWTFLKEFRACNVDGGTIASLVLPRTLYQSDQTDTFTMSTTNSTQ